MLCYLYIDSLHFRLFHLWTWNSSSGKRKHYAYGKSLSETYAKKKEVYFDQQKKFKNKQKTEAISMVLLIHVKQMPAC